MGRFHHISRYVRCVALQLVAAVRAFRQPSSVDPYDIVESYAAEGGPFPSVLRGDVIARAFWCGYLSQDVRELPDDILVTRAWYAGLRRRRAEPGQLLEAARHEESVKNV